MNTVEMRHDLMRMHTADMQGDSERALAIAERLFHQVVSGLEELSCANQVHPPGSPEHEKQRGRFIISGEKRFPRWRSISAGEGPIPGEMAIVRVKGHRPLVAISAHELTWKIVDGKGEHCVSDEWIPLPQNL